MTCLRRIAHSNITRGGGPPADRKPHTHRRDCPTFREYMQDKYNLGPGAKERYKRAHAHHTAPGAVSPSPSLPTRTTCMRC